MEITELVNKSHQIAKDKGFWDAGERNVGELLMLIVSELGEALEAHRHDRKFSMFEIEVMLKKKDRDFKSAFELLNKDTFEDEIADVFIRLGDLCGGLGIDIEKHILAKMKYNETREKLHGKKY